MTILIEERMERAIMFFAEQAGRSKDARESELYEHMHEVAAANLLNTRMLEVLRQEFAELRHEMPSH